MSSITDRKWSTTMQKKIIFLSHLSIAAFSVPLLAFIIGRGVKNVIVPKNRSRVVHQTLVSRLQAKNARNNDVVVLYRVTGKQ